MSKTRAAAVAACMHDWNCFEPLAPGELDRLAESVVAAIERVDAGSSAEVGAQLTGRCIADPL
jgi:AMMECR1 domain-containing protein